MNMNFRLCIPGIEFDVEAQRGVQIVENHPLYREFLRCDPLPPPPFRVPVKLFFEDPRPDPGWPVAFDSAESWLAFRDEGDFVFALPSPAEPGAFWWTARLRLRTPAVTIAYDPEVVDRTRALTRVVNPLRYPLDQLLTMMLLADRGGCIVHAAGLHRNGKGLACVGRSGAGKTTLMRLLEGGGEFGRLSDDRVILRSGDPPSISGTPWAGEGLIASNATTGLGALAFLHQGSGHELQEITPGEAAAQLLPTTSIPWFDEPAMTGCVATLDRLVRTVPTYNLVFRRDRGVADLIDQII